MGLTEETGMEFLNLPQTKTTQITITQNVKNKIVVFTINSDDEVVDEVNEWFYLVQSLVKIYTEGLQRKMILIFTFNLHYAKYKNNLIYPYTVELNNDSLSLDKFYKELNGIKLNMERYEKQYTLSFFEQQKILEIINIINENTDLSDSSNDYKDGFKESLQTIANSIGQ